MNEEFIEIEWKITDLQAEKDVIKTAKYYVFIKYEDQKVETEGYCYFNGFGGIPLKEIKESDVVNWIKEIHSKNDVCLIEERLRDQLSALQDQNSVDLPWKTKTFKLTV